MVRWVAGRILRFLGKSDHRIIAVYAASGSAYGDAVDYVRSEVPKFPVWLLSTHAVDSSLACRCERVVTLEPGPRLPLRVAALLWRYWVVLNVVTFTGERGFRWMKLAPLFVFPWKLLVMNEHRDFFSGPLGLAVHGLRRARDWVATKAQLARDWLITIAYTMKDILLGIFWKLAWTALDPLLRLTPQPWLRPQEPPDLASAISTEQKYVVYGDLANDVSDLVILFERPDTFAAGFQPGRAGFQKDILTRAAFRQLQPGEATAVLAPLADVVLVDPAKLARLGGFPRARSRRCAWLLLYWKACRAGWKSYSVGGHSQVPMIPDRAFPEAEFCFRLLRERPRPASGSFDNRRGSIGFHPRYQRKLRDGVRRILIVSPYLPFPLSHGGAVRIFNLARQLSKEFDLLLVTFREREDHTNYERLSSCFARMIVVDQDERRRPDPSAPEQVAQFQSRAMAAAIREAAEDYRPDLLQIEYTQLAGYREVLPQLPAVLVEHDVTFSLHEQLSRTFPSRRVRKEFDLWYRYESHWLKRYEAVAVMSAPEKVKAVSAGAPDNRTWVVPNGVDTDRFRPMDTAPAGPPEVLYVGSFRHLPNLIGFEFLRREIMPRLWQRFPDVRLRVVAGPDYERHWRRFRSRTEIDPRIIVEGFVEELAPYYARARVVVVPLQVSAGTNIKVIEALSCGKPVVSTTIGCAGLDLVEGEEALIADDPAGFVAAMVRLLDDPGLRAWIGAQARRAAVERFSWQRAAELALEMYESVWSDQINSFHVVRSSPLL